MDLTWIDVIVFITFLAAVVAVSLYAGRKEKTSEDYFLAGRQLTWYLIGFSLIASNISTEHFVGMAGSAFGRIGFAIASFEWTAAVTLVFVAWVLLPRFLRAGIYTMPQYLEFRYDRTTRTIMSIYVMAAYITALLATVLYSGALALNAVFDVTGIFMNHFSMTPERAEFWANFVGIWTIGIIAGAYTIYGGLKAVVWSDLLQGGALLVGGVIITVLGFKLLGNGNLWDGWQSFTTVNADKLHVVLPWNDPDVPSLAVFFGGLWIGHIHYWGCNQFITQRTLAAKNLAEGQKGIMLAALIKLFIPFIIVFPGIMAYQLYGDAITAGDKAYPYMITQILPAHFRGIMFAALTGAVMSTFNSGLNSASTIFTIDIYKQFINKTASQKRQVFIGRITTAVIVVVACVWAPVISNFQGVFMYLQEIWGFISPGIVAAFLFGLILKKAPPLAAKGAMLIGLPLYGFCRFGRYLWSLPGLGGYEHGLGSWIAAFNNWSMFHHQTLVLVVLFIYMFYLTKTQPLAEAVIMPVSKIDTRNHPLIYIWGSSIIVMTAILYVLFW
jgi:solute:Na+ symporter, SSS family